MVALYDQLLTQAGGRPSGSPVARQTNSGTVMSPSQPSYPAPPSPSAGVTGRPSSRPVVPSAPGGLAAPRPPAAPVAPPPASTGPSGAPSGPRNPTFRPNQRPEAAPTAPQPQTPQQPPTAQPPQGGVMLNLNRVPSRQDWVGLMPGMRVNTPYGSAQLGSDGHPVIEFASPEHEARYRNDEANYAKQYGPTPFSNMPGAPQPQVRLGRYAYNPFQGSFLVPPSE